jgi:hypothetical protein
MTLDIWCFFSLEMDDTTRIYVHLSGSYLVRFHNHMTQVDATDAIDASLYLFRCISRRGCLRSRALARQTGDILCSDFTFLPTYKYNFSNGSCRLFQGHTQNYTA